MSKNTFAFCFLLICFTALSTNLVAQPLRQGSPQYRAVELYQDAAAAMRMRRLTEARAMLQKIITDYPDDFYATLARRMLIEILRDLNETEPAIKMLKEMLEQDKTTDSQNWAREMLCNLLYDLQRFREGVELLESWRKITPNDLWTERQLARFYLQSGRKDEAWMILETQLERTAAPDAFRDLLDLAMKSGEIDKLLKTLEDRRTRFRSRDFAYFMSDCYLALGRKDKAIEAIKATPDLNRDWLLLEKLSDLLIDTGKIEEALQTLQQVDSIVPDNWATLKKLGHCLMLLKRKDEALEAWRRPFRHPHFQRQDQYMNYTTVLIEHQLYEEALAGFIEARKILANPVIFAEEIATVLESLGRKTEALEEYIQVFASGQFDLEVFNKLYESDGPAFNLEQKLRSHLGSSYSLAVRQALIELFFRRQTPDGGNRITQLILASNGILDDFMYERLNQDASVFAANFHFDLCRSLIAAKPSSTLALRLGALMLRMARLEPILGQVAFHEATKIAVTKETVDAGLKAALLLELADYAFTIDRAPDSAMHLLDLILQSELLKAAPERAVEAAIARAHIMICLEDYQQAESLLAQNHKNVEAARENIFTVNPIGETDYLARINLESAFLEMNRGDLQKALDLLKNIVENMPESVWTNDALAMALLITRTSVGDLSLNKKLLRARRLAATGKSSEAADQYAEIVAGNASLTVLIDELKAEQILVASGHLNDEQLSEKITEFSKLLPDSYFTADLLERQLLLLRRKGADEAEIRKLMQTFIDRFPNDLRSGRFKKLIEQKRLTVRKPVENLLAPALPAEDDTPLLPDGDVDLDQVVPVEPLYEIEEEGDY
ncbi:MAG: tetratricopeptide repeat protein [Candidatus Riflebacteria bacterium]